MRVTESSANNPKHASQFEVGDHFTYPDYHWYWVCKVPDEVAIEWIRQVAPAAPISGRTDETALKCHYSKWLNKLAVIIEVDRGILALYKHDFDIWLIKLNEGK